MKAVVVMNESHSILPEQEKILNERFGDDWNFYLIPKEGWNLQDMDNVFTTLVQYPNVIFVSPVPYLIKKLSYYQGEGYNIKVYVFHNDKREKKTLPDGRVISTIAKEGWQLV